MTGVPVNRARDGATSKVFPARDTRDGRHRGDAG